MTLLQIGKPRYERQRQVPATDRTPESISWFHFSKASEETMSSLETKSVSRCAVIHLFNVNIPTPRSSATCLRVSPLFSAMRTASCLNSSVRCSPIVSLLCYSKCYQRSGIKPWQGHTCCLHFFISFPLETDFFLQFSNRIRNEQPKEIRWIPAIQFQWPL